jgi:hypothetical protein
VKAGCASRRGRHAFLLVLEGEQAVEQSPLQGHAGGQGGLVGRLDQLLVHHHRQRRMTGDLAGGFQGGFQQLVDRNDPRHQTGALGLGGVHHAAGQDHVHGLGLADETGQALVPIPASQADPRLANSLFEAMMKPHIMIRSAAQGS